MVHGMTARERLPNRRASETFELAVAGICYRARARTCTLSRYHDGRIAELFLSNHKSASAADVGARDAAIAFSFAVQHGADSEAIRLALSRDRPSRSSTRRISMVPRRDFRAQQPVAHNPVAIEAPPQIIERLLSPLPQHRAARTAIGALRLALSSRSLCHADSAAGSL
jgi:hypothetical protein